MAVGIERDVQDVLLGQRNTRRSHGNVPYLIAEHNADLANLYVPPCHSHTVLSLTLPVSDIWDNVFFESIWGSPTIYNFPSGPPMVLDVGCGTGWWIIQMARRWQVRSPILFPRV